MLAVFLVSLAVAASPSVKLRDLARAADGLYDDAGRWSRVDGLLSQAARDLRELQKRPELRSALDRVELEEELADARAAAAANDAAALRRSAARLSAAVAEAQRGRVTRATALIQEVRSLLRQVDADRTRSSLPLARRAAKLQAELAVQPPLVGSPYAPELASELSGVISGLREENPGLLSRSLPAALGLLKQLDREAAEFPGGRERAVEVREPAEAPPPQPAAAPPPQPGARPVAEMPPSQ